MFHENPGTENIEELLRKVDNSAYVIPYFQRGFEWEPGMVCDLIESIVQDYYTGLILLWELNHEEAQNEEWDPVWGAELESTPEMAILDGQQRLSSLYYAFYNPEKHFPNRKTYYIFYIDLIKVLNGEFDDFVDYRFTRVYYPWQAIEADNEKWIETGQVPLSILSAKEGNKKYIDTGTFNNWVNKFIEKNQSKLIHDVAPFNIRDIFTNILDYTFVTYPLSKERNLHDICNIFARVNKKGMKLSTFDLMNAFLYPKGIELRKDLWENLDNQKLKEIDSSMNEYLLKIISLKKQNYCSSKYLYNLIPGEKVTRKNKKGEKYKEVLIEDSQEFKELWNKSCKYAEKARKMIMNTGSNDFGAIKQDFVPNTTMIPVLAAILWEYKEDENDREFKMNLKKWYWSAVFSEDYSGSSDTVMSKDFRDWKGWIEDSKSIERINRMTQEFINEIDLGEVKRSSGRYNAIICILALNNAEDFYKSRIVGTGDYSDQKINDHHIFPKKIENLDMEKANMFDDYKDSILNRTLLFDETNQKINNQKPSKYLDNMLEIHGAESELKSILKSHLINEQAYLYMKNDNFDDFITEREKTIKKHILSILGFKN